MQVIGVYFIRQLEEQLVSNFRDSVNERVRLLAHNVEEEMNNNIKNGENKELEILVNQRLLQFESEDITEVQVIDSRRRVIGTSNPNNQGIIGKKATERTISHALVFGTETTDHIMIDSNTGHRVLAIALPLSSDGSIYAIASLEKVYTQMKQINAILAAGTGIALGITVLLGIFLARTITRPMTDMRKQALVMAEGDFSRKVNVYGDDEIGQLAMTFNHLTQKLEEAQATTEGERRKLSSVLAYMTDGVIAADRQGTIILMNKPAEEILNVSRETVIGNSILKVLELEEETSIEELFDSYDSSLLEFTRGNEHLFVRASFSLIQQGEGPITGLITVLHDVTEQEKIDQERKEFVANVSHELRTPLTTMRSYLEALTDGAWKDESIAPRFLDVTQNETERMIRLVNDLLQLSKLDSKDYKLYKTEVNMVDFFHLIIDRFEMMKAQNVTFIRQIHDEDIYADIDQDKMTQVFDNIISNALKYSPEGGEVTFHFEEVQDFILFKIRDNGVGIPKENISRIFDRFYRVDKARSRKLGGTGLGLAIAREMVLAHDGQIWVESEEGKGTTINLTLPLNMGKEGDFY